METVYKAVLEDSSGGVWSMMSGVYKYYKNRWMIAPIGGFLCYSSLEAAQMFWLPNSTIWECRAEEELDLPVRITNFGVVSEPDVVEAAWDPMLHDELSNDLLYKNPRIWEEGTVAYKRLILTKKVFPPEGDHPVIADLYERFDKNPELSTTDMTMSLTFTLLDEVVNNTVASYLAESRDVLGRTVSDLTKRLIAGLTQWRNVRREILHMENSTGDDSNVVQLITPDS